MNRGRRSVALALAKPGAWADQPWQDDTVVKVGSRIFAFLGADGADAVVLRCRPEDVEAWRQRYPAALGPAPYMRTKPWNRVTLDGSVPESDLETLLEESYDCVVERLTTKERPDGSDRRPSSADRPAHQPRWRPLGQVRALGAQRGVVAVARIDPGLVREGAEHLAR